MSNPDYFPPLPGEEVEIVPLDEASIEDYPPRVIDGVIQLDAFGAPIAKPVPVREGVKDTKNR